MAAKAMPKKTNGVTNGVTMPPKKPVPKPFQPRMRDPESGAPMQRGRPVATANAKPGPVQEPPLANPKKPGMGLPRAEATTRRALSGIGEDLKTAGDFYKGKMGMGGGGKGGK